jgi:homoserine dehydrogenase
LEAVILENTIKVGLLGLGTVGKGVYRLLTGNSENISQKICTDLEIAGILVRDLAKPREIPVNQELLTDRFNDLIDNPGIDIIVEVMGGIHPALEYVTQALRKRKCVVTANKNLIALHGKELFEAARENQVDLLFEGSAGGGIPIIRPLKQCLAANRLQKIMGIINGTTNYILTKMALEGKSLSLALSEAQAKGYAESDPASDIEGLDAAYKLSILASIAFNSRVKLEDIHIEGINNINERDIIYAKELGYIIKLLGIAKDTDEGIEARVHPTFIPAGHPLSAVNDVFNAIFVQGDAIGETMFYGRGAGEMPTASAVVADVMDAARNLLNGVAGSVGCTCYEQKSVLPIGFVESKYYLRMQVADRPGVLASIAYAFGDKGVSLASVIQKNTDGKLAELVMITHQVKEQNLRDALTIIENLSAVDEISNVIRVEGENI